jgi:anti-sigma factor ChrR (cupin superfamily)
MVENGSNAGAEALPPNESHDEFLRLCAIATSGSLSPEERKRLEQHLSYCAECREVMAQYEALVGKAIPALAPEHLAENLADDAAPWSLEEAEATLFARIEEEETRSKQDGNKGTHELRKPDLDIQIPGSSSDILWRHMWWQYAAGLLLIVALGFSLYRTGVRHGVQVARQTPPSAESRQSLAELRPTKSDTNLSPAIAERGANEAEIVALRAQLEQRAREITHLKTLEAELEKHLSDKEADADRLSQEKADLTRQLDIAQTSLQSVQQKLNLTASQGSQDTVQLAALEAKVRELTDAMHERDQDVAHDHELLDHDRDIRDLMGARDLYIAEVYDVAKTGDTQKPFGRVFYTKGKSLVFYAYDLDQQPGIKSASSFQAWGRRGPDRQQAVNLGILYQDDANRKRWVVKSEDPKTLAHIDGVFVTVEPHGGSSHPSGTPLLFTYLRIEPNHP